MLAALAHACARRCWAGCARSPGTAAKVVWRWFADLGRRASYPAEENEYYSRPHAADLRTAVGRSAGDRPATRLVERLGGLGDVLGAGRFTASG
ncbi:hypothetical protein [Streptomyces sp. NPDC012888]|uniref:MmyB family transcriptional regulator n=1 Tax=Streptomyces sp. NPDC012888 TaxID=3364855 RepID=UPI0036740C27